MTPKKLVLVKLGEQNVSKLTNRYAIKCKYISRNYKDQCK